VLTVKQNTAFFYNTCEAMIGWEGTTENCTKHAPVQRLRKRIFHSLKTCKAVNHKEWKCLASNTLQLLKTWRNWLLISLSSKLPRRF